MSDIVKTESLGSSLQQVECLSGNLAELLQQFRLQHIDPNTGRLAVGSFEEGVDVVQLLWDKVKETAGECYGAEIHVDFGDSIPARILEFLLLTLGFKL